MKKILLSGIFILLTTVLWVFADELLTGSVMFSMPDDKFLLALQNCTPYSNSGNLQSAFGNIDVKHQIFGWVNNTCSYKGTYALSDMKIKSSCNFSKNQIAQISSALNTDLKNNIDMNNENEVQNSRTVRVVSELFNDSSACTLEMN